MGFFEWLDETAKRMRWYDISLIKLSVLFTTLFLLTAWEEMRAFALGIGWQWYLGLALACMVVPIKRLFSR